MAQMIAETAAPSFGRAFPAALARPLRDAPAPAAPTLDALARTVALARDATLFAEGDDADFVYVVVSGTIRIHKTLPDGRRQITGFLGAGDFLGLSAGESHVYSAEAVTAASVKRIDRSRFEAVAATDAALQRQLMAFTSSELLAAQDQMLLLGRKTARERLCSFLLALAEKARRRGEGGERIALPMSRTDIADHLGLTLETVSRTVTQLKTSGLIRLLDGQRVQLADIAGLRAIAQG
ncbi:MAG TPA: helix-turn-helix domain-containing protein [Alphaproteobacteria bacterium]|nr:helix-turn-helix domain-containing protein [Alphaproteobacteria bacterium]